MLPRPQLPDTYYPHLLRRSLEGVPGSPGESQKRGQEDRGDVKELGGTLPSCPTSPWSFWPSFRLFLGSVGNASGYPYLEACCKERLHAAATATRCSLLEEMTELKVRFSVEKAEPPCSIT